MPPSINQQLMSVRGRMIKTRVAHQFDSEVNRFIIKNLRNAEKIRDEIRPILKENGLRIDCFFCFHEPRVLTKTKKAKDWVKVLDANNRLKSTLDAVSRLIGVDDKFFFTGICEKVICKSLDEEQVIIKITPTTLRTLDQIKKQI